jgi:hypothetical protein
LIAFLARDHTRLTKRKTLGHAESRAVSSATARITPRKRDFHQQHKIDPAHARDGLNRMLSNIGEFTKSAAYQQQSAQPIPAGTNVIERITS